MSASDDARTVPPRVQALLRQRFLGDAAATGIALAAASETIEEDGVLDELATAWHMTRVAQAEAAAALCGAIAVAANDRIPESEISRRTGVSPEVVHGLGSEVS